MKKLYLIFILFYLFSYQVKAQLIGGTPAQIGPVCGFPNLACASTSLTAITYPSTSPISGLTGTGNCYTDPVFGNNVCRITDINTDPATIGTNANNWQVSNGGRMSDIWWSLDKNLTLVQNSGGFTALVGFDYVGHPNHTVSRPYSALTSGCPRGNCSTHGGWSIAGSLQFSRKAGQPCVLYNIDSTTIQTYTFGSDVVAWANNCSGGISGPPVPATLFNFIENVPVSCVGQACNCLPSDFGTPTWTGDSGVSDQDTAIGNSFSSVAYHFGSGTGQNTGIYTAVWSPTKGCISMNTQTGVIHADVGWSGDPSLTCNASQCTGTSNAGSTFTIHGTNLSFNGNILYISYNTCITGTCPLGGTPYAWVLGTNIVYASEDSNKYSGHPCNGALGHINLPGSPSWAWYYRTEGSSGPGTPTQVNTLPSPNQPYGLDAHCGFTTGNSSDTNPFFWASTTNSRLSSGDGLIPFDQPQGPWWNELDFTAMNGSGVTFREGLTYNTGYSIYFSAANNIINCSTDGTICSVGTDGLNFRNTAGNSTSCIPAGPKWKASKVYPLNYYITPTGSTSTFKVTVAGTAGTVAPIWSSCTTTCTDGSVTWTNIGVPSGVNACGTDVIAIFTR